MSYDTSSPASGVVAPAVSIPSVDWSNVNQWIHDVWHGFIELWTYLHGLQTEASHLAAATRNDPNGVVHTTAVAVVHGCADVMAVQRKTQQYVETYAGGLGLQGVVLATIAGFAATAVASVIVWSFSRYMTLRAALSAVSTGSVTADQARQILDSGAAKPNAGFLGSAGTAAGKILGIGLVGILAFYALSRRRRENPYLIPLGMNPQPDEWSKRVLSLDYIHDDDGQAYTHKFRPGVHMRALEDGSVHLFHPRRRIWKEF